MIEAIIYNKERAISFCLINSIFSIEKAEKVVNDPKNPIIKKYLIIISEISLLFK